MLEYLVSHGCEVHISRHIETNGFGFEIKPRKYYYKVSAKYSLGWYDVAGNTLESSLCSVGRRCLSGSPPTQDVSRCTV